MRYEIGARIRHFRELRGMSQKELAKQVGASSGRVSNWEQGINRPDTDMLVSLCKALKISADELLDMNEANIRLTWEEREIILRYRAKQHMQQSIRVLLGMEQEGDTANDQGNVIH